MAFLPGAMDLFGVKANLTATQGVVSVTVGTVVTVHQQHMIQYGSPGDDKVQAMPILGSRMSPGYSWG